MGVSCCSKVNVARDTEQYNKNNVAPKSSAMGTNRELKETGFVEVLHKDGTTSQFIHSENDNVPITGSELVSIQAETIDLKRTSLQLPASEKILTLKQRICEHFNFNDVLLINSGKVVDITETVGNSVSQGCKLDVLAI